jgi:hypothetical protein
MLKVAKRATITSPWSHVEIGITYACVADPANDPYYDPSYPLRSYLDVYVGQQFEAGDGNEPVVCDGKRRKLLVDVGPDFGDGFLRGPADVSAHIQTMSDREVVRFR